MEKLESERLMSLLRKAMRMLDIRHRDLALRMGVSPSYLSRLFHGVIDLKVDQLVRIVEALGLRPGEFFRLAYPDDPEPPSDAAVALRGLLPEPATRLEPPMASTRTLAPPERITASAYVTAEEVEKQIEETVRRLFTELRRGAAP